MRAHCVLLAVALLAGCGSEDSKRPNVLLVTFDTTRADHLSCYGYNRPTSPNLDALAADGLLYTRAYAVTSWTLPSHASIFTGKLPSAHGAQYDPEGPLRLTQGIPGPKAWSHFRARPLAGSEITLAGILSRSGWHAGAVVAGPWLKRVFGLDRGFDVYDDGNFAGKERGGAINGRPAEDVTRAAVAFVEEHRDEPFFLFLNYYDPHGPWLPEEPFRSRFWTGPPPSTSSPELDVAMYDAEIACADHYFGRFLERLHELGLYEDTWIVVTADHGELMGEHGLWGHGTSLSEPEIRVPLIVKEPGPDRSRGARDLPVQQIDIMPMLLDRLGLPLPPNIQGGAMEGPVHPVVAEVYPLPVMNRPDKSWRQRGDWRVILADGYKFCWSSEGNHALFDLRSDPLELDNRIAEEPGIGSRLERLLTRYVEHLPDPGEVGEVGDVDPRTLEALRSLGYLGGDE